MNEEIVALRNVSVDIGGINVLEKVNLSIYEREFLGIIGPNGGGKTTLLKVILGLIKPSGGMVTVYGNAPGKGRQFIGYVPQHSLFDKEFPVSVMDVVLMGLAGRKGFLRGYSRDDREKAIQAIENVGMSGYLNKQIGKLSGGQRQRVFIARALVSEPRLLLMDEPTASIDKQLETGLYELLDRLKKEIAVVMVSHDIGAISVHVDKIACLNRRLYYHDTNEISKETLEKTYMCPVDIIAHGVPHRVLKTH